MTLYVYIGRRVPRTWFRRQAAHIGGLMSFQENIWIIIKQALSSARKAANSSGKCQFKILFDEEDEDINYKLEWMKCVIQASEELEKEEYEEAMRLHKPLKNLLKKEIPKEEDMQRHFKTKILSLTKIEEAYKEGYGSMNDSTISNKLLEMGILTHIELVPDYETRGVVIYQ